tara:strand:+ start:626 stop:763 length:138 start_codon:yes stop_codon:yes gene_type:complete
MLLKQPQKEKQQLPIEEVKGSDQQALKEQKEGIKDGNHSQINQER